MIDNSTFAEVNGIRRLVGLLFITVLLICQGCATHSPPAPVSKAGEVTPPLPIEAPASPSTPSDPATYLSRLKSLSGPQIQSEVAISRQQLRNTPTEENRLRLALALWTAGGDDQEIQVLAESTQKNTEYSQLRGIGSLLLSIIAERRRSRDILSSSQNRSREARKELESQQVKAETMQRQIIDLERKLAALKEMEKSLLQRPGVTQ